MGGYLPAARGSGQEDIGRKMNRAREDTPVKKKAPVLPWREGRGFCPNRFGAADACGIIKRRGWNEMVSGIAIIGGNGNGKTTLGRHLAAQTGYRHMDSSGISLPSPPHMADSAAGKRRESCSGPISCVIRALYGPP